MITIFLIWAIVFAIIFMALSNSMLRCPAYHDDAVAAATNALFGGGTAVTAALVKDWNCKVGPIGSSGYPRLRDLLVHSSDVLTDELVNMAWGSVHFSDWLESETICENGTAHDEITDSGAGTQHVQIDEQLLVHGRYNRQLHADATMINTNTKVAGTIINGDISAIYPLSAGSELPYAGGELIRAGLVASAASTADTYSGGWESELQKGDVSGMSALMPRERYILRGVGMVAAVKDLVHSLVKITPNEHSDFWITGFGPGNFLGRYETIYLFDGIEVQGNEEFKTQIISGAASTPYIYGIFESKDPQKQGCNIGCGVASRPSGGGLFTFGR